MEVASTLERGLKPVSLFVRARPRRSRRTRATADGEADLSGALLKRMTIRPYSESDRQACLEILESNTPEFFTAIDSVGYAAFLDQLPGPYFVVAAFGQTAACGGWALDADGVADLTWGMVGREFHRRGLGGELLHFRLKEIRNQSRATLVRVRTTQLVQGFFLREGFKVIEVVADGFSVGLDKVTMEASR